MSFRHRSSSAPRPRRPRAADARRVGRTWARVGAAAVLALAMVACGGGDEGSTVPSLSGPAPVQADLVGVDMGFRPSELVVAQGGSIRYVNEGAVRHDLRVEGEPRFFVEVGPGEERMVAVGLDKGSYVMFCSLPGHREAGMVGTLIVG